MWKCGKEQRGHRTQTWILWLATGRISCLYCTEYLADGRLPTHLGGSRFQIPGSGSSKDLLTFPYD